MLALLTLPEIVFAQSNEFQPLVGIPGTDGEMNTEAYINAFFALAIGIAAILATIKLIKAGVTYMFSDVVPEKQNAKGEIGGALLGLLIVLGSVTILNEINPKLTTFNIFENAATTTIVDRSPQGEQTRTPVGDSSEGTYTDVVEIGPGETVPMLLGPLSDECRRDGGDFTYNKISEGDELKYQVICTIN